MSLPKTVQPGKPKLPEPPSGWAQSPLGDHLTEIRRPAKLADGDTYSLVTVKRARGGVVKRADMTGNEISVKSQFYLEPKDFLVSKRQIVHGACGVVPEELAGSIVSNEYSVFNCRNTFDLDYLKYLSHSVYFQQTCFHSSIGVHVEKLIFKVDEWLKWNFNIPPLAEQQKIAKILSTWDKAIAATEKLIENARTQKRALMQQLLSGKRRLHGNSSDWWESPLSDIVDRIYGGGTPPRDEAQYWDGDIPWLTVKDLVAERISGAKEHITSAGLANSASNLVPSGTVITATRMALGKAVIADRDVAINQDLKAIVCGASIRPAYLHYWLLFHANHIAKLGTGSTVKGLQLEDLNSLRISLPRELREQDQIVETLTCADREVAIYESQLSSLRDQRAALLTSLISGQRRVKLDGGV